MTKKINVGILFGGKSGEHEVSIMSARSVMAALNPGIHSSPDFNHLASGRKNQEQYQITLIGITPEGKWLSGENIWQKFKNHNYEGLTPVFLLPEPGNNTLYARKDHHLQEITRLDVIFPVLHGTFGEDGTIQGYLELAGIAYVGAGVLASSTGMDKILFKDLMTALDLPVAPYKAFTRHQIKNQIDTVMAACEEIAPYPLFVKPANLGSSVGISKCKNRSELREGLTDAARYDRRVLTEKGLNAMEIEVSVLGNETPQASTPGEVRPIADFYSYDAKYVDGTTRLFIPAPVSDEIKEQAKELAVKVFKAIDGAGLSRVDFLLEKDSRKLYINEINTLPGFTSISMYPKLWEHDGLDYPSLVHQLIQLAISRKAENDQTIRMYGCET